MPMKDARRCTPCTRQTRSRSPGMPSRSSRFPGTCWSRREARRSRGSRCSSTSCRSSSRRSSAASSWTGSGFRTTSVLGDLASAAAVAAIPLLELDRRDRALAALGARVPRSAARRARGDGARSAAPGCGRARGSPHGARERNPLEHPAGLDARGRTDRRRARRSVRRDDSPLARRRELPGLGRAHRRLRATPHESEADRGSRPLLHRAGRRHALHLESAPRARARAHGPRHESARAPLPIVLAVFAREEYGSAADLGLMFGALGAGGARGRARLQRGRPSAPAAAHVRDLLRPRAGAVPRARDAASASGRARRALAVAGLAAGPINPLIFTVLTEVVPRDLRGRIFGAVRAGAWASIPLGVLLGGVIVGKSGVAATFLAIGVLYSPSSRTGSSTRRFVRWTAPR